MRGHTLFHFSRYGLVNAPWYGVIANLLLGAALLFMGRQLFWIFVGGAGFILGSTVASQFLIGPPEWLAVAVAAAAGVLALVLALIAQRLAVAAAGFIAGSYGLFFLIFVLGVRENQWLMVAMVGGGLLGALLVLIVFDWALIGLSSLAGAALIVQLTNLGPLLNSVFFIALAAFGIGIQGGTMRKQQKSNTSHRT